MGKKTQIETSATKYVHDMFDKDILNEYVEKSIKMIELGKPIMDGLKNVAACHYYSTEFGKIGTFASWIKGSSFNIYIGSEHEINDMKRDFYKMVEDSGFRINKSPKDRAEDRKREDRRNKKKKNKQ
jgi:hypothetical protein